MGTGPGAVPLNLGAYLLGAPLAVPILFRHRWPFQVMLATAAPIFFYYIFARRNISPAPLFFVPLYDAAVAGYLIWAVSIAAGFMLTGLIVVELSTREGLALPSDFLSQIVILVLAVVLGRTGAQPTGSGGGDGQAAAAGRGGTRGGGGPGRGRGTAADRARAARHGGAQHGHYHRAGGFGVASAEQ